MKICIPVNNVDGIKSKICNHFGSAFFFLIYNTTTNVIESISNSNKCHVPGTCNPLVALELKHFNIVVCRGMGKRAIQKLNQVGFKVFKTGAKIVEGVVAEYKSGKLSELTIEKACTEHECD